MKLEKLFGSSTKVDILKYLIFKRQWVSIRALDSELTWSFPAIKKQIDLLLDADIVRIDKTSSKWSIYLEWSIHDLVKKILLFSLEYDLKLLFMKYDVCVNKYFLWKVFGNKVDADLVVIYTNLERNTIEKIKEEISDIFREYFVDLVSVVFMPNSDFERRNRLADKFVISLINCEWVK